MNNELHHHKFCFNVPHFPAVILFNNTEKLHAKCVRDTTANYCHFLFGCVRVFCTCGLLCPEKNDYFMQRNNISNGGEVEEEGASSPTHLHKY